jgi:hypothetical protein
MKDHFEMKHEHLAHLQRAREYHRTALDQSDIVARGHNATFGALNRVDEVLCRALDHARQVGDALKVGDVAQAREHNRHLRRFLSSLNDELTTLGEKHDVAATAHRGVRHGVKKASAHVNAVLAEAGDGEELTPDTTTIQVSDGVDESGGSGASDPRSLSFAARRAELKRLAQIGEQQKHDWSVTRGRGR